MKNLKYLQNLNKEQIEAVSYLDGPLLIVAGAGSGKTKVLTSKIAYIIESKHNVDAVTNIILILVAKINITSANEIFSSS